MSDRGELDGFIDKWLARWPEWRVALGFVPAPQRELAGAWFALRQELMDAAWGGADPRPGEAKLAWWAEELHGWTQGRRRHPLGLVLQRQPVPWSLLAACLPALRASRDAALDPDEAVQALEPFAEGINGIAANLLPGDGPAPARSVVLGLLAERLLEAGEGAVPMRLRARLGDEPGAAVRAWAQELLQRWPPPHGGSRAGRIHAALVRERLRRMAEGAPRGVPRWRTPWIAWRAARAA